MKATTLAEEEGVSFPRFLYAGGHMCGRARGEGGGGGREVHSNLREEKGGDEKDPC